MLILCTIDKAKRWVIISTESCLEAVAWSLADTLRMIMQLQVLHSINEHRLLKLISHRRRILALDPRLVAKLRQNRLLAATVILSTGIELCDGSLKFDLRGPAWG